jgi:hypothetical protein
VCKEEYIKNSWLETVLDCWQDPLKYEILDNPTNTSGEPKDIVTVFSKTFMQYWGKQLTSESVFANKIAETYASISFWGSFRDRAINKTPIATVQSMGQHYYGLCLRPLVAGTITNRAVDPIGLVIPSASKNKVGSEIGGHFTSPKGWKYVYADLDSIQAIITALYCAIGTEKVIAEKNNSRIPAKINVLNNEFSISVITGTKKDKTALAWLIANRADWLDVSMSKMEASEEWKIAKGTNNTKLMAELIEKAEDTPYKKGKTAQYAMLFGAARMKLGILLSDLALAEVIILYFKGTRNKTTWKWEGGIASEYFNYIEFLSKGGCKIGTKFITLNSISSSFLGREMSNILHPRLRKKEFGGTATNATVQSIDVDCLCFLADGIKKASRDENIIARYSTSVHDEICFLVQDENADRVAKIFDEVHEKMYIRLFDALGLDLGSAPKKMFTFDSVDISTRKTKKPKDKGITLSNMDGYDYEISASIDDDEFYESAEYWDDGSVPEMTSFETTKKVIQKAKTQVKQCCKDYNTVIQDPTQH